MSVCYIVGAGDFAPLPEIKEGDFIIAADGGYDSLRASSLTPNLLVGDLDSIENVPTGVEILRFKSEKDETDMHLAFLEGMKRGYREFMIYGGLGGRADHSFANYSLLYYIAKSGCLANLVGLKDETTLILDSSVTLPKMKRGSYFSVFAFGGDALGVSIKNAKYEVSDVRLSPDFPLGVSNEFCDTPPTISVNKGALLVIFQKNS